MRTDYRVGFVVLDLRLRHEHVAALDLVEEFLLFLSDIHQGSRNFRRPVGGKLLQTEGAAEKVGGSWMSRITHPRTVSQGDYGRPRFGPRQMSSSITRPTSCLLTFSVMRTCGPLASSGIQTFAPVSPTIW